VAASVVRAHQGRRRIATTAEATQAGSAAVGIAPWRRAASRRRGVAGRRRSLAADMDVTSMD
jgi:hypothetical protein